MKYSVRFYLHTAERKGGHTVTMSLTWNAERMLIYLPFRVPKNMWDEKRQQCKTAWADAACYNRQLTKIKKNIQDLFFETGETFHIPTKLEVKNALGFSSTKTDMNDSLSFEDVYRMFLEKESLVQSWSLNTKKNLTTVLTDFSRYKKDCPINSIDEDTILGFIKQLHEENMSNYSIDSLMRKFRRFMRWAYENKYVQTDIGFTFKPKLQYAFDEPLYLLPDELKRLESCYVPDYLVKTRDVFVFCCFSGLRYSDVCQLRKSQIHDEYFEIITEKTNDTLKIELNSHTKTILEKYRNIVGPMALPVLSNQRSNAYLKEIGSMAKLERIVHRTTFVGNERRIEEKPLSQLLTFHVARKTFITMALFLDIQPEVFMKWTGHKNFNTLKRYLGVVDKMKEESMKKFDTI